MYMAPIAVVSRRYLAPCPVNLTIVREVLSLVDGNFAVTNGNGDVVFKVQGKVSPLRRRVLSMLLRQLVTRSWTIYAGDTTTIVAQVNPIFILTQILHDFMKILERGVDAQGDTNKALHLGKILLL
ncbi:unnamed protein product [Lactuca virosa]|uniref:Uncharacterized protein n=1 Tax=Lactuca virosa TaxID=75947 RepID=A0AAU9P7T9_9ASTR|nr:unnamed protein product [Lactuca virosa]